MGEKNNPAFLLELALAPCVLNEMKTPTRLLQAALLGEVHTAAGLERPDSLSPLYPFECASPRSGVH